MRIDIQKWYILTLNSSLEMLVFNLWSPKMLRSVPLAGRKDSSLEHYSSELSFHLVLKDSSAPQNEHPK